MSIAAQSWAWEMIRTGRTETITCSLVLMRFADRADSEGICWPGHERTASDLCISDRNVRSAIQMLQASQLLHIERRHDRTGRQLSNRYRLLLPAAGGPADTPDSTKFAGGDGKSCQVEAANFAAPKTRQILPPLNNKEEPTKEKQQPTPSNNIPPVVVFSNSLIAAAQLTGAERKQIELLLKHETPERAQLLADELAGALRMRGRDGPRGIKNPVRFLAALTGVNNSNLSYAVGERELRDARAKVDPKVDVIVEVRRSAPPPPESRALLARLRGGGKK